MQELKQGLQALTQSMPTLSPHLESSNSGLPAGKQVFDGVTFQGGHYSGHCSSTSEEQPLPELGVPCSAITAGVHLPGLWPFALGCVAPLSHIPADAKLTSTQLLSQKKPGCVHTPVTVFLLMVVVYLAET